MRKTVNITPSLEDYLESIYILKQKKRTVRVKDLAKYLNVKAPSVVEVLKKLEEKNLVVHRYYEDVELTKNGVSKAKTVYKKHNLLKKFLYDILGLEEKIAEVDACRIEHYLSKETLERIIKFINFIETCPQGKPDWLDSFYYFVEHKKRPPHCKIRALKTKISK